MSELNFILVGCGRIAQRHAENIKKYGNLAAVCDIKQTAAIEFAEKYDTRYYFALDEMLQKEKNADVVSICTPNGLHPEHAIKALIAGKHVVCEKPMALTVTDCGKMITSAEKANKRLFIVKQNRFNPPVIKIKEIIDDGRLGKINSIQLNCFWNRNSDYYRESDWKGTKEMDGGILFTQFSHFIDLVYWMIGDVKKVYSFIKNYAHQEIIEFEDTGVAIVEFFSGTVGTINFTINSHKKNMEGSLCIFGDKGTVKIGGQYLNELEYQDIEGYVIKDLPPGNPANNYGQYQGSMSNHEKIYENVVDVLNNQGIISTNGFEGMKTVEIIDKIYSAANEK